MFADNVRRDATIDLNFNQTIQTDSVTEKSILILGNILGQYQGVFNFSDNMVVFTPDQSFQSGETIHVFLSKSIQNTNGENLTTPYSFTFSTATTQSDLIFSLEKTILLPDVPFPVQLGTNDINQDSFVDFIVGCNREVIDPRPAQMAILLSSGETGTDFILNTQDGGVSPCCFLTALFDQDEYVDIISLDFLTDALVFLQGKSDWTFESINIIPFSQNPIWGDISDYDGDGNIDLIIAGQGDGISLYKNYEMGRIEKEFFPADGSDVRSVAWADVNNDGLEDVVAASYEAFRNRYDLSTYIRASDGTFSTLLYSSLSAYTIHMQLHDFDFDGDLDVAAIQPIHQANDTDPPGQIEILFNDGAGKFTSHQRIKPNGTVPSFIDCRDINGDGSIDLIATNSGPNAEPDSTISIYLNDGTGNFTFSQNLVTFTAPKGLQVVDFSGDGRLDIAVVTSNPTALQLFKASSSTEVYSETPHPQDFQISISANPNPFRNQIFFQIQQPQNSTSELLIFDILGRAIFKTDIPNNKQQKVVWNGKNLQGNSLPAGVYWAVLRNGAATASQKLILIK